MIFCAYEDRPEMVIGLKLLALSLAEQCPEVELHVFSPLLANTRTCEWFKRLQNVRLVEVSPAISGGWDMKPWILLDRLHMGYGEVIWLDSDLLITRDPRPLVADSSDEVLVVAEEHRWAVGNRSPERTVRLGLPVGRVFRRTINTCVVRVTEKHRELLERWEEATHRPDYRKAQVTDFDERPWYLGGDQDLLAGLLGAEEFSGISVRQIRADVEIAQCFLNYGYGTLSRVRNMGRGLPTFIHAQGPKPWLESGSLFAELSPYCVVAERYAGALGEPAPWLRPRLRTAKALDFLTNGSPNLRGLPPAVLAELRLITQTIRSRLHKTMPSSAAR